MSDSVRFYTTEVSPESRTGSPDCEKRDRSSRTPCC